MCRIVGEGDDVVSNGSNSACCTSKKVEYVGILVITVIGNQSGL